ncbi:MAG: glycosyltransferase [candidate division FCPU426 bacterium]
MPGNPPSLKVLVITGTWPPMRCGVGDYTARLCRELARAGCRVQVVTSSAADPADADGVEVKPVIRRWSWGMLDTVRRAAAAFGPDLALFQWPTAAYGRFLAVNVLPSRLRRWFPGLPLVTTLHELRYFKAWTRWRALPALHHSRRVVLVDPADRPVAAKLHPAGRGRLCHIPIGSNLPAAGAGFDREAGRRVLGLMPGDFAVAFFGFANPPKGLDCLLAALAPLRSKRPELKLLLLSELSERDPYQRRLARMLATSGLAAITLRPGYAPAVQTAERLACADCAVLPFQDGVSQKRGSLLACMAQGLPVVTTAPAALESAQGPFQNERNMLMVNLDTASLAQAVERLMDDPGLRAGLGRGALEASAQFDWKAIGRRYLELFHSVREGNL